MILTLQSFALEETRSLHEDTNYLAGMLKKNNAVLGSQVTRINNVNNGTQTSKTYNIGWQFNIGETDLTTDQYVFSYLLINHGGGKAQNVEGDCTNAILQTALSQFSAADAAIDPGSNLPKCVTSELRAADDLNSWWNQLKALFKNVSSDRCDGPVAIDRFSFTGDALSAMIRHELFTTIYLGTNSAVGCGSNSKYSVQWNITV